MKKCFCYTSLKKIHLNQYQYVGEFNFKTSPSHFVEKYNAVHKLILDTTYSTVSHQLMFTQCFENVKRYISAYYYYIIIILPLEKRPSRERETCSAFFLQCRSPKKYTHLFWFVHSSLPISMLLEKKYCVLEIRAFIQFMLGSYSNENII